MGKLTPKFSIITVTYNAGRVLEPTIRSVISQTYHNIEYIVIDGNSKDNTLQIADTFRPHISHLVSEPDKGIYDAMNKGLALATGDYVCFLNAGDSLKEDNTLERMANSIPEGRLPDILYGETALVDMDRHFLRMRRLSAPEHLTWKSFKKGMLVCHQAFFAKRDLAEPYDLQYSFSSDFDWCIRIMKKSADLHNTHLTIINYLEEGATTQNRKESLIERFHIMVKYYGFISTLFYHLWFILRLFTKPGQ